MKRFFLFLTLLSAAACAQSVSVIAPETDASLTFPTRISTDRPLYIVNANSVIYQDGENLVRIKADLATFRRSKEYDADFFALDKNGIYFKGKLVTPDTAGFKIVGQIRTDDYYAPRHTLWKNHRHIFDNDHIVKADIDVATFRSAYSSTDYYFKDKNFLYFGTQKIEGSDATSASEPIEQIIFDKNHVYIAGKIATYKGENLKPVNCNFFKTSKYVVNLQLQEQPHMDAATLVGLSRHYAKDKNHLYWQREKCVVPGLDLSRIKVWDQVNRAYFTDGKKVYAGTQYLQANLDAKTFGMLPHSDFCYDKNGVYQQQYNEKTKTVDNVKFPFTYGQPVSPENTFITVNSRYIIYDLQAYDPWDKKHYKLTREQVQLARNNQLDVAQIDPAYANLFDYKLYKHDGKIYCDGKDTGADAETFERLGGFYKDKNHVYRYLRGQQLDIIDGIDAASAKAMHYFIIDKNAVYSGHSKIIGSQGFEWLAVTTGHRPGCGLDKTPSSDFYILKNAEGFWVALVSDTVKINFLGRQLANAQMKQLGF
ncbi:hypothetical protein FLLO111716_13280 [Flavobacterium longum]|uniref:DKNYY domain-containing protein n=1 Tax=Flavobacterium longum TaxID=1299340 RepID=UPI0039E9DEEE